MTDASLPSLPLPSLGYLLDTNVISETAKLGPAAPVLRFLQEAPAHATFISVFTLGELRRGAELTPDSMRRAELLLWLERDVRQAFATRLLPADAGVMETWATMVNATGRKPGQLPLFDSFIAATALHHGLTVVARNPSDFGRFGVLTFNPYEVLA